MILCLSILISLASCFKTQAATAELSVQAKAAVLLDVETGELLYSKDENEHFFIASLTKLMPLILFFEAIESGKMHLNDSVLITATAISETDGSNVGLREGQRVTVEDLLKAVFLASGCDACIALCEHYAGSVSAFVGRMNQKAAEMGLKNTHFENCTGVDVAVERHYSSALDVAKMSQKLLQYSRVTKYSSTTADSICNGRISLKNTNYLLTRYKDCFGLKTGTTTRAGYCLSAVATREGATLCAVVLGATTNNNRLAQATMLLDYGLKEKPYHSFRDTLIKAPTCTQSGEKLRVCEKCSMRYTQSIAMLNHEWGEWEIQSLPSCTLSGNKTRICSHNSEHKQTEIVPALGHDWGEWQVTTAPTCTQEGVETRVCKTDEKHTESRPVAKLNHSPAPAVKENEVAATCTKAGSYDLVVYCKDCGKEISRDTITVKAPGHQLKYKVTAPTATKIGYTERECARCGAKFSRVNRTAPTGVVRTVRCSARTVAAENIIWSAVNGAEGYQIQISTADGKSWGGIYNAKTATSYLFKGLAAGGTYLFRVRIYAKGDDGRYYYGAWSSSLVSPTLPAGTTLVKLTGGSKSFTAQWKRLGVTGYQIQYGTKANFAGAKTITVNNALTYQYLVKNLKAKGLYYVRIRTYKTIAGANYVSAWSKAYAVKTK